MQEWVSWEPLEEVRKPSMHNPGVRGRRKQNWEKDQIEKSFKQLLRNHFSLMTAVKIPTATLYPKYRDI